MMHPVHRAGTSSVLAGYMNILSVTLASLSSRTNLALWFVRWMLSSSNVVSRYCKLWYSFLKGERCGQSVCIMSKRIRDYPGMSTGSASPTKILVLFFRSYMYDDMAMMKAGCSRTHSIFVWCVFF